MNDNNISWGMILLIILAITYTFTLYMGALSYWINALTGWYLYAKDDITCKVYNYLWYLKIKYT